MQTEWFDVELVRAAFLLGIAVSVLCYERLQITTSSVVVPGYLGLAWSTPQFVATSFAIAWLVYLAIHSWSARFVVLSRSSKFYLAIVAAACLQAALAVGADESAGIGGVTWMSIGFVIPGLMAHDMARQGPWKTSAAVVGSSLVVAAAVGAAIAILPELGQAPRHAAWINSSFGSEWLPLAMLVSVVGSVALQRNHGLRCGGFVGAAYISQMLTAPLELACYAVFTALTCWIVSYGLKPRLMLFGRRKFAAMLIVGCLVSWAGSWLGARWISADFFASMSAGRAVISVFLTGLIASDIDRSGVWISLRGTALCTAFTLLCTLMAIECAGPARLEIALPLCLSAGALAGWFFAPDLRRSWSALWPAAELRGALALVTPSKSLAIQRRDFAFTVQQIAKFAACAIVLAALAAVAGLLPAWREIRAMEPTHFGVTKSAASNTRLNAELDMRARAARVESR